jgi:trimethylamine--corrinoid protein Co-methyltransferase
MTLKHRLKVLSKEDITRVHEATLKIFEETGVIFHCQEALEIFKKHGAKVNDKTVHIPRKMVESALETCPSIFKWRARNDANSVTCGEGVLLQVNSGCVNVHDMDRGLRTGNLKDFGNIMKLAHAGDMVKIVGGNPCEPVEIDFRERHLYAMYEILKNTDKALFSFSANGTCACKEILYMTEISFGQEGIMNDNHIIGVTVATLSPLVYPEDVTETLIAFARRNQIVSVGPMTLAGLTGPIKLFGSAVLQNAESLAGIILTQLINPGCPVIYLAAGGTVDMKNASYVTGTPEGMLVNIASYQVALDLYHLPVRCLPGMTDSKLVDYQAGYETMQGLMMGILSGAHVLHESLGCFDSIMTTSYEKIIIDQELFSRVLRIWGGIDTSVEAMSLDIIQEVGPMGSFLTHPNTFEHFRERWSPTISDWDSREDWEEKGSEDVLIKANKKVKEILANAPEKLLDSEVDKELKAYMEKVLK